MANADAGRIADLVSTPLEAMIVALGSGIGRSQAELDRHSIETQRLIDEDPVLSQYGLHATWYQIPSTQMELKVSVHIERQDPEPPRPQGPIFAATSGFLAARSVPRLQIAPVSARFQNLFSYDTTAASTVTLTIAAVPPPGEAASGSPTMTEAQITEIAAAHLVDVGDTGGVRTTINYNAGARAWYVVQTQEEDDAVTTLTLLKIDDESGQIVKRTGGR